MLIDMKWYDSEPGGVKTADFWGLWAVINDLYDHHPEVFGAKQTARALKRDLNEYLGVNHENYTIRNAQFYTFFAERLQHYGINPFADISCAFVSPAKNLPQNAKPILERFKQFSIVKQVDTHYCAYEDIGAEGNRRDITTEVPRYDYVLTGNVINDPFTDNRQVETILACGMLAKKGGKIMHVLTYGEDKKKGNIENEVLHVLAGQKLERCDPPGRYIHNGSTSMMVMQQQEEIAHTPSSSVLYHDYKSAEYEWLLGERIQNRAGDISFTLKEYYDHFFKDKEALQRWESLGCGSISGMAHADCFADKNWQTLADGMYYTAFPYREHFSYHRVDLGPWQVEVNDQHPSAQQREEIRNIFGAWWDEKVAVIAAELKRTPEQKITDQRFYSTGKLGDEPGIQQQVQ